MATATHKQIADNAKKQIAALGAVQTELAREENDIRDNEFERPLNAAELDRLGELRNANAAILDAAREINFVTLKALETTDELKRIKNALAGTVKDLKKTADRIAKIGQIADVFRQALGGVENLSKQLEMLQADEEEKK